MTNVQTESIVPEQRHPVLAGLTTVPFIDPLG